MHRGKQNPGDQLDTTQAHLEGRQSWMGAGLANTSGVPQDQNGPVGERNVS